MHDPPSLRRAGSGAPAGWSGGAETASAGGSRQVVVVGAVRCRPGARAFAGCAMSQDVPAVNVDAGAVHSGRLAGTVVTSRLGRVGSFATPLQPSAVMTSKAATRVAA